MSGTLIKESYILCPALATLSWCDMCVRHVHMCVPEQAVHVGASVSLLHTENNAHSSHSEMKYCV